MDTLGRGEDAMMEDIFLQDDLHPTIAEHATECNSLFHRYMVMPEIVPDPTIVDDQLARFTLWASNMDVYGPLNVSLDYRLRFSPTVVDIIHQLLGLICDTLKSCKYLSLPDFDRPSVGKNQSMLTSIFAKVKPIDEPPPTPSRKRQRISEQSNREDRIRRGDNDASDSDSDVDPAEDNISKITDIIGGTVTRLFRLNNAIRKSAKADRARKIERYRADEDANRVIAELRHYTECYIRFRFPMAPDALRSALVEANAMRLRRLYYQRSHRRRIGLSVQSPRNAPAVQLPKIKESATTVHFDLSMLPKPATNKTIKGAARAPPVPVTNATTARQSAVRAFYAKSTTEVPRAKSVQVNNKLSFPPIPPTDECPYCGVIIEFKGTAKSTLWHNHVIRDLEPFICVFAQCLEAGSHETGPPTFETSNAWIGHMQNAHGHTWECRAPSHDPITFDQEIQYREHSIKEHEVPETHAGTLSNAARRPVLDKIPECPFGDDFQPPPGKVEPSAVFSSEALQSHVAAHIKEIGLLTLQKLPNDLDADTENVDSDQPLEDDGLGPARWRASMYSVLDDDSLEFRDDDAEHASGILDYREEEISASVTKLDLEDKDDSGMAKLHRAVQAGRLDLVQSLIHRGAKLSSEDGFGRTALHYASMEPSQSLEMMALLLNAGGSAIINLGDHHGQTALHYATERGLTDIISILIEHGADICRADNHGFPPYLWAVVAGQTRAMDKLLTVGANADPISADGNSALYWAAGLGRSSVVAMLMDHGASVSHGPDVHKGPLEAAAAFGDLSTVKLLLLSGGDPNYHGQDGWSAIHWAAEEGHFETVHLLLDRGANINAVSSYGTSPLHCAANGGHVQIVRSLLSQRADPLKSTCHGWTALHHAAYMGHSRVVQCLLEDDRVRSSASQQDNHGWSALHLAIHSRDLPTVKVLLDSFAIAEPSALVDENGLTAEEWLDLEPTSHLYKATSNLAFSKSRCCRAVTGLRQAVLTGSVPMIRLLLRLGHDVDGMDSGRRTALYYAAKTRMLTMMDLLLQMGADPNIIPAGRKSWREFISDDGVLRRLNRAGYGPPDPDPEVKRQIQIALRAHGQPSALHRSGPLLPDRSILPSPPPAPAPPPPAMREPLSLSAPAPSAPSFLTQPLSETPTRPPAPPAQTYDKKRKAKSNGSGLTRFFRRLLG